MTASAPVTGRPLAALRVAHLVTGVLATLGILGALRTGLDRTENLIVFETGPGLALTWLVLGLVGGGMAHEPAGAVRYLILVGPAAAALTVGGLIGAGPSMFTGDPQVVGLHGLIAVLALGAVALVRSGTRARPEVAED
ncbi:MAG: hypothetical protein RIB67_10275 [Miltoncostaeaceae bacterium]